MKRHLYNLVLDDAGLDKPAVLVFRTDNNIGRIGVVFRFNVRYDQRKPEIPKYIIQEARELLFKSAQKDLFNT